MIKRSIVVLVVGLWVMAAANAFAGCVASCPAGTTDFNGFCYVESGGEITITDYAGSESDVEIPSVINGKVVTIIGEQAFRDCSLTSVTIPDSVTSIGDYAFYQCYSLTSVTIGNSVTSIGYGAFDSCTSLASVTIPDSVTSIGDWAFSYCHSLTSVTIPDSVTSIGGTAFHGCWSLTSIDVDPDNGQYISAEGVLYNKDKSILIEYPNGKTDSGFSIPDSVTSIGDYAFNGCTYLISVTIPDSVTSIGWNAFGFCSSMTSIDVNPDNGQYISVEGVLYNKDKSVLIRYPIGKTDTEFSIPDSVTSIGDWAFDGCSSLTSVTIPDSVTSIGDYAFSYCTSMTSVTIPDSVTSIGRFAFDACFSLTSVTIPDSVTSFGDWVFCDCTSLAAAYFLGDAPVVDYGGVFTSTAPGFKVCHTAGAAGFNVEPWLSYNVQVCCTVDADCGNGVFCDGTETCAAGSCVDGTNPCTEGQTCNEGLNACVTAPACTRNADCPDNGMYCDGVPSCSEETSTCVAGTPVECGDGQLCDEGLDACVTAPACTENADCPDNGMYCDGTPICTTGECFPGTAISCGDGQLCDEEANACVIAPACTVDADCPDNGMYCDGVTVCSEETSTCVAGTPVECGDGQICDEGIDECIPEGCDLEGDLDGDCDVDKEDSKLLNLGQKTEKTALKIKHKAEKAEMKAAIGSLVDCGMGWDLDGDCDIDKDDSKLLKLQQKSEKTDLTNRHKAEKAAMKAAL